MENVLIDTGVILDFFFDRKPYSKDAATILSFCESKKLKGYVTPVIFSNTYYLLRQKAHRGEEVDFAAANHRIKIKTSPLSLSYTYCVVMPL